MVLFLAKRILLSLDTYEILVKIAQECNETPEELVTSLIFSKTRDKLDKLCDHSNHFTCPVNDEGRNRTCRKDGFCAVSEAEGCGCVVAPYEDQKIKDVGDV